MRTKFLPLLILAYVASLHAAEETNDHPIHEHILGNGLKVVVKEDHRAPVVISQVWYKVGSADESSGATGVSHVLEHMMFKGTERVPEGQFSAIIARQGGRENAFTSRDYTGYYQLLEKSRLPIAFRLEADRMRNLALKEEAFRKELDVVKEERRMRTDDNPSALAYEQLYAMAFNNAPYHHPVIGWMEDLDHLELDDLKTWYRQWYAPNNATLVVVGDVNPEEVFRMADAAFGDLEPEPVSRGKPRLEPPQRGERRAVVRAPARLPYLVMGYRTPVLVTTAQGWEPYALQVLSGVLDGGRGSRFASQLIRDEQVAASAGAGYSLYGRYDGLFVLNGVPAQGKSVAELEQAIDSQIEQVRQEPIGEDELARVKAQVIAGEIFGLDSIGSQANLIGAAETVGLGWESLDEYVERIQAITPEQVREVAQRYLNKEGKIVVQVEPLPLAPMAPTSDEARS